jgi:tetratricopeptide (TPR) repeat protein
MKNTAAAIEAYRRAVDLSTREYRAWYGLGQTYEIMNMLLHALFYFRNAAALHPHDARMWCAIGGCLLGLERWTDAERSYTRAVALGGGEGIATQKRVLVRGHQAQPQGRGNAWPRGHARVREVPRAEADLRQFLASWSAEGRWSLRCRYPETTEHAVNSKIIHI